jgi:hypothetical protein
MAVDHEVSVSQTPLSALKPSLPIIKITSKHSKFLSAPEYTKSQDPWLRLQSTAPASQSIIKGGLLSIEVNSSFVE